MPRVLDRYLLRQILPYFLFGIIGAIGIYILSDLFDHLDVFVDNHTPFRLVVSYYVSFVPYILVFMAPIAVLLSTFLGLGGLTRFNEITAMKMSGLSLYRVFLPVYVFGLVISVAAFGVTETSMPGANRLRKKIYDEQIRGRLPRQFNMKVNMNYLGQGGRVYAVRRFDVRRQELQDVVVQVFQGGQLVRRVDARIAQWKNGVWTFYDGIAREFNGDDEKAEPFVSRPFPEFTETPDDLSKDSADPDQMTFAELGRYVGKLRDSGRPTARYATEQQIKVAYPFVNFIAVLLAAPLATRLRRGTVAIGFSLSFILFIAYLGFMRFGQVLGYAGQLPPLVAAWLGNVAFGTIGLVMLLKAPK